MLLTTFSDRHICGFVHHVFFVINIPHFYPEIFQQVGHVEFWHSPVGNLLIWPSPLPAYCKFTVLFFPSY